MKSLWSDAEAAQFSGPLGPRVYTSRLLGRDKSLVLHGKPPVLGELTRLNVS